MLGDIGERLGAEEPRDRGDLFGDLRQPVRGTHDHLDPAALGHVGDGGEQSQVGEHLRVDARDGVPQGSQRLLGVPVRVLQQRCQHPQPVGRAALLQQQRGLPQLHGGRHQVLLRAVMQVTLDAASFDLECLDDHPPGVADIAQFMGPVRVGRRRGRVPAPCPLQRPHTPSRDGHPHNCEQQQ